MFSNIQPLICHPIGHFHSTHQDRFLIPRQPGLSAGFTGRIELFPHHNFSQALDDLYGFEKIWLLFWFHGNTNWKPKVMPPRGEKKRGVFATRSPHRPNPIGLSCVTLKRIDKLTLYIDDHDLLDGTPILDIKPYLSYSDSYPAAKAGWLEELPVEAPWTVSWEARAQSQALWIQSKHYPEFIDAVTAVLKKNPFPSPSNRIKTLNEGFELAFKTWRVIYACEGNLLRVREIKSGYATSTLKGESSSRWDDVAIHVEFLEQKW